MVERSFPVLCLRHSGIVGGLKSAITLLLDSMMLSLCILGLVLVLLSSLFSDFLVFGNLPRGYVIGKPSFGHGCHVGDLF